MAKYVVIYSLLLMQLAFAGEQIVVLGLFKDRVVVSINGKQQFLSVGEKSPGGALLISADSSAAVFEINDQQHIYKLGEHISAKFSAPKESKQVIVAPSPNGMYITQGSINGFQTKLLVDTGATLIAMNAGQAKRLGINYKLDGVPSKAHTASGIDTVYIVTLKTVKLGDLELNHVEAAVHTGLFPEITLLGNSFLNRVDMLRNGKLLTLKKKY